MLKRKLSILMSGLLIVACSTQNLNSEHKGFSTKSVSNNSSLNDDDIKPSVSPDEIDILKKSNIPDVENFKEIKPKVKNKIKFKLKQELNDVTTFEEGVVEVILNRNAKVRVKNGTKKLSSEVTDISELIKILEKNSFISGVSLKHDWITEKEVEEEAEKLQEDIEGPSTDRYSTQRYYFPKNSNIIKICKELRKLDYVISANPSLKPTETITATLLGRQVNSPSSSVPSTTSNPPSDPFFSSKPESSNWWYFKRHRIFRAWSLFGNTSKPKIAVIDTGFDTNQDGWDKPNYLSGFSIKNNPLDSNSYIKTNNDIAETRSGNYAHGSIVSSVLASPKDNGQGLSGVIPGANIVPIKFQNDSNWALACAIDEASNLDVDVINISQGLNKDGITLPITYDAKIVEALKRAVSKGKFVVITAGNSGINLDTLGYDIPNLDGVLIVGGIQNESNGYSGVWRTPFGNTNGSNYGKVVDLGASAIGILVPYYRVYNGRGYELQAGTSLSAPIVSGIAGMVKKYSTNITPQKLKQILIYSSRLGRSNINPLTDDKFRQIGANLNDTISTNIDKEVEFRQVDAFNALILGKYLNSYQSSGKAIVRLFNSDDNVKGSYGDTYLSKQILYSTENYYDESFWGIDGLTSGNTLSFKVQNLSSGYTYGYQVYMGNNIYFERFSGVAGVYGAENNITKEAGHYAGTSVIY